MSGYSIQMGKNISVNWWWPTRLPFKFETMLTYKQYFGLGAMAAIMALCATATAQTTTTYRPVLTCATFLRNPLDARSGGMGETGVATSVASGTVFFNNAKLAFSPEKGALGLAYMPGAADDGFPGTYMGAISGYGKTGEKEALSGSLRYYTAGNIQFMDASGNTAGNFSPKELAIDGAYARQLSDQFSASIGFRFIHSNLTGSQTVEGKTMEGGSAFGSDIAFFYTGRGQKGDGLNLGATLRNLGTRIAYGSGNAKNYIPANLAIGAAYAVKVAEDHRIEFATDLNKLLVPTPPDPSASDYTAQLERYRNKSISGSWISSLSDAPDGFSEELKEITLGIGAEYAYKEMLQLRAGYLMESRKKGGSPAFTAGIGLLYRKTAFNLACLFPSGKGIAQNTSFNTLRFGLEFAF